MIGINYSFEFAKDKFGLTSLVDEYIDADGTVHSDNGYAPLAMGAQTWGVHVRDMAGAYASFANDGIRREERTFTKVYDSEGNLIIDNTQDSEQILSEKSVNYMNYCLVNATSRGTGTQADFTGHTIAGKTGSTSEFKDRWYCGFTGYYTAAVWTGYDRPEVIRPTSTNPACILFKKVMQPLHEGLERVPLYDTSGMITVSMCLDSGKRATEACGKDGRDLSNRVASALCYPEDAVSGACTKHVIVELCNGGGKPTEWCEKFAEVDETVKIEETSYLKMTKEEYNAAAKAIGRGLDKEYLNEDFILVGNDEEMEEKDCPLHTQEAWEAYLESLLPDPTEPTEPTLPSTVSHIPVG